MMNDFLMFNPTPQARFSGLLEYCLPFGIGLNTTPLNKAVCSTDFSRKSAIRNQVIPGKPGTTNTYCRHSLNGIGLNSFLTISG